MYLERHKKVPQHSTMASFDVIENIWTHDVKVIYCLSSNIIYVYILYSCDLLFTLSFKVKAVLSNAVFIPEADHLLDLAE